MDIIAEYKVPMIGTIAMAPGSEDKVKAEPEKYKFVFRACLNARRLVKYLVGIMDFAKKEFGFNKVFIMNQDVGWTRATADLMVKNYFEKAGWTVVGQESYPTGTSDFSSALMKAKYGGAQVILPLFDMPQSGTLVKQCKSMKIPALMAGFISPLAGPGAWKTFDGKIVVPSTVILNLEVRSLQRRSPNPLPSLIVETLEARRAAEGSAADGDLLILARWTLQHRNAGARAGTEG